jgi:hypothetical protein
MNFHFPMPMGAVGLFIPLAIFIRLWAGRLDRQRIAEHIEKSGGEVSDITWNPFGKGWFGTKNERIYEVTYRTRSGRKVEATCKTSMFSGVYWTSEAPPGDSEEAAGFEGESAQPEAIECPQCGATIPPNRTRCAKCGWSYKDR